MQLELDNERVNRLFGANRSDFGDFCVRGCVFTMSILKSEP